MFDIITESSYIQSRPCNLAKVQWQPKDRQISRQPGLALSAVVLLGMDSHAFAALVAVLQYTSGIEMNIHLYDTEKISQAPALCGGGIGL